jgi:hypothetical protein
MGRTVGGIIEDGSASTQPDRPWSYPMSGIVTSGKAPTLRAGQGRLPAQFGTRWLSLTRSEDWLTGGIASVCAGAKIGKFTAPPVASIREVNGQLQSAKTQGESLGRGLINAQPKPD